MITKNFFVRKRVALAALLVWIPICVPAYAAEVVGSQADPVVTLIPAEISPGDTFLIKITGLIKVTESLSRPTAVLNGKRLVFSRCTGSGLSAGSVAVPGCFLAIGAVPLETEAGRYEIDISAEKGNQWVTGSLTLVVKETVFPVQRLTLPEGKVILSPEDQKRADMEAVRLRAIFSDITERLWEGGFIMPLENAFSTGFGVRRIMNQKKTSIHGGVDIRGKQGAAIKAVNRGRAVLVEELFYGGNTVVLDHGGGIYTVYMHLSRFNVRAGEVVSKRDVVGLVGSTGRATGPHLHYGVRVQNIRANPVSLSDLPL